MSVESRFLAEADKGRNLFLTGMAGTGKSTLLRRFIDSRLNPDGAFDRVRRVDVTAPTGIAALNVDGQTVHRWAGMLLGPRGEQTDEAYWDWLVQQPYRSLPSGWRRVEECQCLVIDEISMLPGRQLQFLEWMFRKIRRNEAPWGGCQVIVVGDFLQLAPVRMSESEPYDWAFDNPAWGRSQFHPVELTVVRRQDEAEYVEALAAVRTGHVSGRAAETLHRRVKPFPPESMPRLFTHNVMVDKRNEDALQHLDGEELVFEAETCGSPQQVAWLEKNLLCPRTLRLKIGARVMTLRNDPDQGFVNGSTGNVVGVGTGSKGSEITVRLDVGKTVSVPRIKWHSGEDQNMGWFEQFPMRLAYALTIHKSQGLTLDSAYIDIRAAREPGQAYVALSRVRTLAGLQLKEWFRGLFVSQSAIQFHDRIRSGNFEPVRPDTRSLVVAG